MSAIEINWNYLQRDQMVVTCRKKSKGVISKSMHIFTLHWNNTFHLVDFVHQTVDCWLSHVSVHALVFVVLL